MLLGLDPMRRLRDWVTLDRRLGFQVASVPLDDFGPMRSFRVSRAFVLGEWLAIRTFGHRRPVMSVLPVTLQLARSRVHSDWGTCISVRDRVTQLNDNQNVVKLHEATRCTLRKIGETASKAMEVSLVRAAVHSR